MKIKHYSFLYYLILASFSPNIAKSSENIMSKIFPGQIIKVNDPTPFCFKEFDKLTNELHKDDELLFLKAVIENHELIKVVLVNMRDRHWKKELSLVIPSLSHLDFQRTESYHYGRLGQAMNYLIIQKHALINKQYKIRGFSCDESDETIQTLYDDSSRCEHLLSPMIHYCLYDKETQKTTWEDKMQNIFRSPYGNESFRVLNQHTVGKWKKKDTSTIGIVEKFYIGSKTKQVIVQLHNPDAIYAKDQCIFEKLDNLERLEVNQNKDVKFMDSETWLQHKKKKYSVSSLKLFTDLQCNTVKSRKVSKPKLVPTLWESMVHASEYIMSKIFPGQIIKVNDLTPFCFKELITLQNEVPEGDELLFLKAMIENHELIKVVLVNMRDKHWKKELSLVIPSLSHLDFQERYHYPNPRLGQEINYLVIQEHALKHKKYKIHGLGYDDSYEITQDILLYNQPKSVVPLSKKIHYFLYDKETQKTTWDDKMQNIFRSPYGSESFGVLDQHTVGKWKKEDTSTIGIIKKFYIGSTTKQVIVQLHNPDAIYTKNQCIFEQIDELERLEVNQNKDVKFMDVDTWLKYKKRKCAFYLKLPSKMHRLYKSDYSDYSYDCRNAILQKKIYKDSVCNIWTKMVCYKAPRIDCKTNNIPSRDELAQKIQWIDDLYDFCKKADKTYTTLMDKIISLMQRYHQGYPLNIDPNDRPRSIMENIKLEMRPAYDMPYQLDVDYLKNLAKQMDVEYNDKLAFKSIIQQFLLRLRTRPDMAYQNLLNPEDHQVKKSVTHRSVPIKEVTIGYRKDTIIREDATTVFMFSPIVHVKFANRQANHIYIFPEQHKTHLPVYVQYDDKALPIRSGVLFNVRLYNEPIYNDIVKNNYNADRDRLFKNHAISLLKPYLESHVLAIPEVIDSLMKELESIKPLDNNTIQDTKIESKLRTEKNNLATSSKEDANDPQIINEIINESNLLVDSLYNDFDRLLTNKKVSAPSFEFSLFYKKGPLQERSKNIIKKCSVFKDEIESLEIPPEITPIIASYLGLLWMSVSTSPDIIQCNSVYVYKTNRVIIPPR